MEQFSDKWLAAALGLTFNRKHTIKHTDTQEPDNKRRWKGREGEDRAGRRGTGGGGDGQLLLTTGSRERPKTGLATWPSTAQHNARALRARTHTHTKNETKNKHQNMLPSQRAPPTAPGLTRVHTSARWKVPCAVAYIRIVPGSYTLCLMALWGRMMPPLMHSSSAISTLSPSTLEEST